TVSGAVNPFNSKDRAELSWTQTPRWDVSFFMTSLNPLMSSHDEEIGSRSAKKVS
ncbi:hypothetical protein CEXT_254041, partial [Caerostris extrusa]